MKTSKPLPPFEACVTVNGDGYTESYRIEAETLTELRAAILEAIDGCHRKCRGGGANPGTFPPLDDTLGDSPVCER